MKLDNIVNKIDFTENIVKINNIIDNQFMTLFNIKQKEINILIKIHKTNKKILGFLNSMLANYGMEIISIRKTKYCKEIKKNKSVIDEYKLIISDIINNIPNIYE